MLRDNPVTHDPEALSSGVSDGYRIIQNEEHAGLLNALVDESGAHFETAGAFSGGRRVFITMKLPGHINVGGVDPVDTYLAAINSHDGSLAFTFMVTPVRIVCANTLNVALNNRSHQFRVRHTSGAQRAMVTQARQVLGMTFDYLNDFQAQAEQMINTTLSQVEFEEIILREFGPAEDASPVATTRAQKKIEQMADLFSNAATQAEVRETAWAGFNALAEWNDHYAPTRGDERDTSRATKAVMNSGFKTRALELML